MLRSFFVLLVGSMGSAVGVTAALAIPSGTFGCVVTAVAFGVMWGWAGSCFLRRDLAHQLTASQSDVYEPNRRSQPRVNPPMDFQKRLSAFTNHAYEEPVGLKVDVSSSMPFWSTSHSTIRTPAKSNRYIRLVLLRIRQILRS